METISRQTVREYWNNKCRKTWSEGREGRGWRRGGRERRKVEKSSNLIRMIMVQLIHRWRQKKTRTLMCYKYIQSFSLVICVSAKQFMPSFALFTQNFNGEIHTGPIRCPKISKLYQLSPQNRNPSLRLYNRCCSWILLSVISSCWMTHTTSS